PLGLPPPGQRLAAAEAMESEAVRLFVERALAAQPDFRLDDTNAAAVADIVTRLDGLPLAIELAAARVRILAVETLRARLHERLAVLTGGPRDLPARQQTLRGATDWSHDRLAIDHDNLRAAFDWAVDTGDAEISLRLITAAWRFWQIRGHLQEATERVARALAMPGVSELPALLRAEAYAAAGSIAYWRGDQALTHV